MNLRSFTMQSPGVLGLNTQQQDDVLDPRYATIANNCVIDRAGLLASRKGVKIANGTAATGTPTIDVMHSYVQDDGTEIIVSTGGNKFWSGTTTMTDSTGSVSVTADYWKFQNIQGNVIGVQASHEPVWWDGSGNFEYLVDQNTQWSTPLSPSLGDLVVPTTRNGYYYECTTAGAVGGTEPTWDTTEGGTTADNTVTWTTRQIPKSNEALAAFGRLWLLNETGTAVEYSDLLIPHAFSGGSAGSIDLDTVWPNSNDTGVSLAVHNNNLIIFCERSIVIYANADNVDNIYLVETITANGCIARDTVQTIGDDIFYLSNDGVRTLGRTILQNNMPMGMVSDNIRDEMILSIQAATYSHIQSTYNEQEGFYLITFPDSMKAYVSDVRIKGTPRWLTWDETTLYGLCTGIDNTLRFGLESGYNATYTGYLDGDPSTGDTDLVYSMKYRSGWVDSSAQVQLPSTSQRIWKKAVWYMSSEFDLQVTSTWGFDFLSRDYSETKTLVGAPSAKYGIAQYGIDSYGATFDKDRINIQLRGTGALVRIGMQLGINNGKFAFNRIDLFLKQGRMR